MSGIKIPIEAVFNANGAQQGLDAVTGAAGRASDAAGTAGAAVDKVVGAAGKAEDAIDKVTGAAGEAAKAVGQVGAALAKTGVQKLSPVEKEAIKNVRDLEAAVTSYFRVAGAAGKRLKASGQEGKRFEDIDWNLMYPGDPARAQKTRQAALSYAVHHVQPTAPTAPTTPGGSQASPQSPHSPSAQPPARTPWTKSQAGQIVGAGLNAAGPAGGVVNGAIGAGMSGGIMAGLAGLGGGLAALALGKVVGAVVDKVGAAQKEEVGYDTLKRTLGDVNVGFNMLKQSLQAASYSIDVGFDEGQHLATQFARGAGLPRGRAGELAGEVNAAGGFSRSFGLDPSQGTAFFAQQRAMGTTTDERGSRRLAMMIGEAIAKSDAFTKADEVMDAIAGYAAQQTRAGMNAANVEGFASTLTGMVASKRPGMDPASSAALLGRMNAAVVGGGAAGEAGQNFAFAALSRNSPGMDPVDAAILQQQGLFGTRRKAFGAGSAYAGYMGKDGLQLGGGADDDKTNLQAIMEHAEQIYGNRGPKMKKLMANAMGNFFGLNETQMMAMMNVKPAQLGRMGNRLDRLGIDMKDVNATGISRMGQIEADGSLSEAQKDEQMRKAAAAGQEPTLGGDVRKSMVAVENIQQEIAGKLVPLTNEMRNGIMYLAGKGNMSAREIQEAVLRGDSRDREKMIGEKYGTLLEAQEGRLQKAREKGSDIDTSAIRFTYRDRPEIMEAKLAQKKSAEVEKAAAEAEIARLTKERAIELGKETQELTKNIQALRDAGSERARLSAASTSGSGAGGGRGSINPPGFETTSGADNRYDDLFIKYGREHGVSPKLLKAIAIKESGLNPNAEGAVNDNGTRDYGLMQHNSRYIGERGITDWRDPEQSIAAAARLLADNTRRTGSVREGVRAYNGSGPRARRYADDVMSRVDQMPELGGTPLPSAQERADAVAHGTPLPEGTARGGGTLQRHDVRGQADVRVSLAYPDGRVAAPPQNIAVRLGPAQPAGAM